MRPQESRRHADEPFYFDHGELIVDKEVLPAHYPDVLAIDGKSIVCTYINAEGERTTRDFTDGPGGQFSSFRPGDQLVSVKAGTGELAKSWVGDKHEYACKGRRTGLYEIQPGDLLLTERQWERGRSTVIIPADEPLPRTDPERDDETYRPLGVITTEGKLVAWGAKGIEARRSVDLAVASKLVTSWRDNMLVDHEVSGSSPITLRDRLTQQLPSAYLNWFRATYSEDFLNVKEPRERLFEFPGPLSDEHKKRYLGSMSLH